jgi:hypothetical protein
MFMSSARLGHALHTFSVVDMRVPQIRAITNAEFIQMMDKCRPPTGWPSKIGQ